MLGRFLKMVFSVSLVIDCEVVLICVKMLMTFGVLMLRLSVLVLLRFVHNVFDLLLFMFGDSSVVGVIDFVLCWYFCCM